MASMTLVEQLGVLHKALLRDVRKELAARTDRPFQQLGALKAIARSSERCTQAALADKLFIDAAAASRLVDRLVAEGLVKRREGTDRRSVHLELTRAAARELALIDEAFEVVERQLVGAVGARDARRLAAMIQDATERALARTP
jgi:DNA-binding MarR family transcriptional regulator